MRRLYEAAFYGMFGVLVACSGSQGPAGPPGDAGPPGANALTSTSPEPAGANCADGGTKVEVGLDTNGNGVLDPSEVNQSATTYICNGSGKNALVSTSPEPGGTNCQFGGVRIDTGVDTNNNGTLDQSEITSTTYACNTAPSGSLSVTTGIVANIKPGDVSTSTSNPITVRFTLKDSHGYPVDIAGKYSINQPVSPSFALAYYTKDSNGNVQPLTVYTQAAHAVPDGGAPLFMPSWYTPLGPSPGQGTLVENGMGAGDYTYTFPTTTTNPTTTLSGAQAVAYDSGKMSENHVVWIIATRQTDMVYPTNGKTQYAVNYPYYYIPAGGTATPREIVQATNCWKCHDGFRLESTTSDEFVQHGGKMIDGTLCNVCHNPGHVSNPWADSKAHIHRIHYGENIAPANQFHGIAATFPQDVRRCDICHAGALQGTQSGTNPSRRACGSCHDYVDFTGAAGSTCTDPVTIDTTTGLPKPCKHVGGTQADDTQCATCHKPADIAGYHVPVEPPDPNNSKLVDGGVAYTNAAYMAQGGYVPAGAAQITYVVKSVQTWTDTNAGNVLRPSITFKLQMTQGDAGATDVVFNTASDAGTVELMDNFVGSPSVQFAWAVPQDSIMTPADFNASSSVYIKDALNGKAGTGTLSGPDSSGYYTLNTLNAVVAANATMLTGGVGYTYALNGQQPLTETDLSAYPYTASNMQGGLIMNSPNVWKTATGFKARRAIVDNNQCKDCHGVLGVRPNFHAGQRNDGPTCSFCHNPNRTSSAWSAGSKYYIHAIHGARKRTTPFTWHASSPTDGFWDVEFPSPLNDCKVCHLPNTYDFTATASLAAIPNMQPYTVATGKYTSGFTISPYVTADGVTSYGTGFGFNATTGVGTDATPDTLVISPIMSVCSSCHDSPTNLAHMQSNGGHFYDTRANALNGTPEQCMICHGPGRVAAIGEVHLQ